MSCAIRAEIAHSGVSGVCFVAVCLQLAFGDFDVVFGDNLVEGIGAAAEGLAGIAVAEDVGFIFEDDIPLDLAAVALSVAGRHIELGLIKTF